MDAADQLILLFHRRWAVPVLAELHRTNGAKFVTLVKHLDASPGAVRATLDDLIAHDLVEPNPGYGHPMRPEYILTPGGRAIAPACDSLLTLLRDRKLSDLGLRKWPLPILFVLAGQPLRFTQIRDRLGAISDRALTIGLKQLVAAGLVDRGVTDAYPPTAHYAPHAAARPLQRLLRHLA